MIVIELVIIAQSQSLSQGPSGIITIHVIAQVLELHHSGDSQ